MVACPSWLGFGGHLVNRGDPACVDAQSCSLLDLVGWHSAGACLWPCTARALSPSRRRRLELPVFFAYLSPSCCLDAHYWTLHRERLGGSVLCQCAGGVSHYAAWCTVLPAHVSCCFVINAQWLSPLWLKMHARGATVSLSVRVREKRVIRCAPYLLQPVVASPPSVCRSTDLVASCGLIVVFPIVIDNPKNRLSAVAKGIALANGWL